MRVLMLSPTLPWPLNTGAKLRVYYELRALARAGHQITLLALDEEQVQPEEIRNLKDYCSRLEIVPVKQRTRMRTALKALFSLRPYRIVKFENPKFRRQVSEILCEPFDVLWVHFVETLAYVPQIERQGGPLVVLDQHNADERFWATYASQGSPWVRIFAFQNLWKLRYFQRSVLRWVDVILSVSQEDAEFTRQNLPNPLTEVWVVPNGVDIESLCPSDEEYRKNAIIFCGSMDVLMNIDAAKQFAQKIFPKVRENVPDAEFWIVGRNPPPAVRALEGIPGVRVTGSVEDVRPYYAQAKVAVAPFRYGGGTKLKVLEAMALGVPVVATQIGYQGILATPGKHLFVEEKADGFAMRVIELLQDDDLWKKIATQARELVMQKYDWGIILEEPIAGIEELVRRKGGSS